MATKEISTDTDSGDDMRDTDNETSSCLKSKHIPGRPKELTKNNDKEILPDVQESSKHEVEEDVTIEEKQVKATSSALSIDTMVDDNLSPVSAGNEPMECSSSLTSQTSPKDECGGASMIVPANSNEDVVMADTSSNCEANVSTTMNELLETVVNNKKCVCFLAEYHAGGECGIVAYIQCRNDGG